MDTVGKRLKTLEINRQRMDARPEWRGFRHGRGRSLDLNAALLTRRLSSRLSRKSHADCPATGSFPPPALPGLNGHQITLPTCHAHYPGGSRQVRLSFCFPVLRGLAFIQAGRHPHHHFRGLLRLHTRYGPLDCSTAQGDLCRGASAMPLTQQSRPPTTGSNRQLSG